jgi:preprotein translocase subunit SecG
MEWLKVALLVLQLAACLAVIVLVLLQHGKGADLGAAFGSGSSGSLFGASGSANFFSRATAVAITLFFVSTIGLAFLAKSVQTVPAGGVMSTVPSTAPATPKPANSTTEIPK